MKVSEHDRKGEGIEKHNRRRESGVAKSRGLFFFFFLLLTFLVFSSAQSRGHRAHSRPSFDIKRWRTREQTMTLTMVL